MILAPPGSACCNAWSLPAEPAFQRNSIQGPRGEQVADSMGEGTPAKVRIAVLPYRATPAGQVLFGFSHLGQLSGKIPGRRLLTRVGGFGRGSAGRRILALDGLTGPALVFENDVDKISIGVVRFENFPERKSLVDGRVGQ